MQSPFAKSLGDALTIPTTTSRVTPKLVSSKTGDPTHTKMHDGGAQQSRRKKFKSSFVVLPAEGRRDHE
jgi:hypothetical protein